MNSGRYCGAKKSLNASHRVRCSLREARHLAQVGRKLQRSALLLGYFGLGLGSLLWSGLEMLSVRYVRVRKDYGTKCLQALRYSAREARKAYARQLFRDSQVTLRKASASGAVPSLLLGRHLYHPLSSLVTSSMTRAPSGRTSTRRSGCVSCTASLTSTPFSDQ